MNPSTNSCEVSAIGSGAIVRLSPADLLTIRHAIECRIKSLEELHWRAVAMGATDPLYRNIAHEIEENKKAESAICVLFDAQFKPNPKDEPRL